MLTEKRRSQEKQLGNVLNEEKKSKNTHLFVHMYVNALLQNLTARLNQTLDLD